MDREIVSTPEILKDENTNLQEVTFEDIESIEEIITGATSGFGMCCIL